MDFFFCGRRSDCIAEADYSGLSFCYSHEAHEAFEGLGILYSRCGRCFGYVVLR
jgi:hypothetical protein